MSERRLERIKSQIMQEVALIINQELKDPRLTGLVSVTKVDVSPDLKNATVHVSVFATEKLDKSRDTDIEVLNHSAHYIMFLLSKKMTIKYIPELEFKLDNSMEETDRMNRLFRKIEEERNKRPEEDEAKK